MGSYIQRLDPPRNNEIVYKVSWSSGMYDYHYRAFEKCGDKISNKTYEKEYGEELWAITEELVFNELWKVSEKLRKAGFEHEITTPDIKKHSRYGTRRQNHLKNKYRRIAWRKLERAFSSEKGISKKYWEDIDNLKMLQQLYIDSYYGGFIYRIESKI